MWSQICAFFKASKLDLPEHWRDAYLDFDKYDIVCHWQVNRYCNYRCEYCFAGPYIDDDYVTKYTTAQMADAFDKTGLVWHIRMDGGEPFFRPNYVDLCAKLTENHLISLNTNLSNTRKINEFVSKVNSERVIQFKCSYHHGEIKRVNGYNSFLNNINNIRENNFNLVVTVVFYPLHLSELIDVCENFKSLNIPVVGRTFKGTIDGKVFPAGYTIEEKQSMQQYLDPLDLYFLESGTSYKYKKCRAGEKYVLFDNSGNLQRCGSINKSLGNIFKGNIELSTKAINCTANNCDCPYVGYILTTF